jgi:hypothetical protein
MARGKRYQPEQVVNLLRQIEVAVADGKSTTEACKEAEIVEQMYLRWRKEYGGLQVDQAKRLKERRWSSSKVIGALADVMVVKGVREHIRSDNVLTQEGKAGEKRRFLSIPHGMLLTSTVPPSGFHEQGLSVRP